MLSDAANVRRTALSDIVAKVLNEHKQGGLMSESVNKVLPWLIWCIIGTWRLTLLPHPQNILKRLPPLLNRNSPPH